MAWVKLDHKFHWDEVIECLSDRAYRLYVGGLCYCNWQETDGFVRASQLPLIAQRITKGRRDAALQELLDSDLWNLVAGGYQIANYLKFQPSRDQLEAHRLKMKALGQAGGIASGLKRGASSVVVEAERLNPVSSVTSRHVTTVTAAAVGFRKPNRDDERYVRGGDGQPRGIGEP